MTETAKTKRSKSNKASQIDQIVHMLVTRRGMSKHYAKWLVQQIGDELLKELAGHLNDLDCLDDVMSKIAEDLQRKQDEKKPTPETKA